MLSSFRDLRRFAVHATDGDVGAVNDVLFDDRDWGVRYLVVETGGWLRPHPVLLAPELVASVTGEERRLDVTVDRARIANSPSVEAHPPVSRHREDAMRAFFGLPPLHEQYPHLEVDPWGQPVGEDRGDTVEAERRALEEHDHNPHLHSARAWLGYGVEGRAAHLGVVDDVLFEPDDRWHLRYLVVDTGRWLGGKRRLVATDWIGASAHDARFVRIDATREKMAEAPDFETAEDIDHGAERWLFRHYGFSPRR